MSPLSQRAGALERLEFFVGDRGRTGEKVFLRVGIGVAAERGRQNIAILNVVFVG